MLQRWLIGLLVLLGLLALTLVLAPPDAEPLEMTMPLSQPALNRLAAAGVHMLGQLMESITYYARATPTSPLITYANVQAHFEEYRLAELGATFGQNELMQTDRRCRIATVGVTWTPSLYDELTRADGTRWRVLSVSEGTRRPWTMLPVRLISAPPLPVVVVETYATPGAFTWIAPAGVTSVQVECWGGGATGAPGSGPRGGGGGGGGAYSQTANLAVSAGNSYPLMVGNGFGEDSWFGSAATVMAQGGAPGVPGGAGGAGGAAASCVGASTFSGGAGGAGDTTGGGGGGSSAGPGYNGYNGTTQATGGGVGGAAVPGGGAGGHGATTSANGTAGMSPGGGGGGGGAGSGAQWYGAAGQVVLTYSV